MASGNGDKKSGRHRTMEGRKEGRKKAAKSCSKTLPHFVKQSVSSDDTTQLQAPLNLIILEILNVGKGRNYCKFNQ
jgi:hypothetical protein